MREESPVSPTPPTPTLDLEEGWALELVGNSRRRTISSTSFKMEDEMEEPPPEFDVSRRFPQIIFYLRTSFIKCFGFV